MNLQKEFTQSSNWAAYGACIWSFVFAFIHIYWGMGGTIGLPEGSSVKNTGGALLIIDIISIPICFIAALVALGLLYSFKNKWLQLSVLISAWVGTIISLGHAIQGFLFEGLEVFGVLAKDDKNGTWNEIVLFEGWFLIGGILFGLALRNYYRIKGNYDNT